METWVWFTLAGLAAYIVGAGILATGLIVSKERAEQLGVTRLAGSTLEVNLRLPAVADRVRQSTRASGVSRSWFSASCCKGWGAC